MAERTGGEIVACDSQQVYIGMDIGTAKPTADERRRVRHHALDLVRPDEPFHAARWAAVARAAIADIATRRRLAIVVGGTGLYYRALVAGLFEAPPPDASIRARHRATAESDGPEALHRQLGKIDPEAAAAIGPRDVMRASRALEIYEQTGVTITELRRRAVPPGDLAPTTLILDPPLATLRASIAERTGAMMAAGFLDEVRALRAAGYGPNLKPLQALGYGQLGAVLDGAKTVEQAVADTVSATFAYARRQRTWFRKEKADLRFEAIPELAEILAATGKLIDPGLASAG